MSQSITDLEPKRLFGYFYELNQIPRCSKNEQKAGEYLLNLAANKKIDASQDDAGNIVFRIPGTRGRERKPIVILQSHIDMVCEKEKESAHDFSNDPIAMRYENNWIRADGTTLGADNGIGVATALAVTDETSAQHGPLELLFTVDEETGLTGAQSLAPGFLKGRTLLNLDSEEEGALYIGCAGGKDTLGTLTAPRIGIPEAWVPMKISVGSLKGGHSGIDIHLGRGNAIKLIADVLRQIHGESPVYIAHLEGGTKRNAIPRDADAVVFVHPSSVDFIRTFCTDLTRSYRSDYAPVDPGVTVSAEVTIKSFDDAFSFEITSNIIGLLTSIPNGALSMSAEVPGLVETSSNLASVKTEKGTIVIGTSQRSSVNRERDEIAARIGKIMQDSGFTYKYTDGYPGWKPNLASPVLAAAKKIFTEFYEQEPPLKAIHAGLECGIFGERYPGMDMVSFGPTITGAHSPDEQVHVGSVKNFYTCLLLILKKLSD
jgi:dipeptidase D